ncbi:MAG: hypothetical protein WCJ33_09530 [Pseudomonadota bacterium]
MKFPKPTNLSTINYEPRDSYIQANKRVFLIEKGQSVDSTSQATTNNVAPKKDMTLSADSPLNDLEKEIILGESYILQIDEMLDDWNYTHGHHYEPLNYDENAQFMPNPDIERIGEELKLNPMDENDAEFEARQETKKYKDAEKYLDKLEKKDNTRMAKFVKSQENLKERYDANIEANNPGDLQFKTQDGRENQHFGKLPQIAQKLLTTISKGLVVVGNIKLIYKSKISGGKLNRFNQTDMLKISAIMDKFIRLCKDVGQKMKEHPHAVFDFDKLTEFYPIYNKAEQKWILLTNELDKMYEIDKLRYSYNQGAY